MRCGADVNPTAGIRPDEKQSAGRLPLWPVPSILHNQRSTVFSLLSLDPLVMRIPRQDLAIACVLVFGTLAVYGPALGNKFVDYDDTMYIGQNQHVLGGLTWANVRWAFSNCLAGIWHPLTWLSLQLDVQ